MLPVKADALHPYLPATFYVLFLIVEKQTCICLEVELIKESPVNGRIWLKQMHILGHQLVGDKAKDTVFLFHLTQLARPVAQSIDMVPTVFQQRDEFTDARCLHREDIGVVTGKIAERIGIFGPSLLLLTDIIVERMQFPVHGSAYLFRQHVVHEPLSSFPTSQQLAEESHKVVLHQHATIVKNDVLYHCFSLFSHKDSEKYPNGK